jgi:hypothetical protein
MVEPGSIDVVAAAMPTRKRARHLAKSLKVNVQQLTVDGLGKYPILRVPADNKHEKILEIEGITSA